jgi:hypothetical protein
MTHIPLPTLWLCQDHYRQSCTRAGYELPILPAFNVTHQKCDDPECTATADVLINDMETLKGEIRTLPGTISGWVIKGLEE